MWDVGLIIYHILNIIISEILESKCSHVLQVVDSACDNFICINNSNTYTSSVLILPLPLALNQTTVFNYVPTLRFCQICSLVLHDITNLSRSFLGQNYSEPLGHELAWPEYTFPGYPHNDYHVFIYFATSFESIAEPRILAHLTRRIQNAFFLSVNESSLKVFRTSPSGQTLDLISEQNHGELGNSVGQKLLKIGDYNVTYNGAQLTTMTCPICSHAFELFETTGDWFNPYDAIVYYAYNSVNATIEFQYAAAVAKMKPDEDGDWGDWVDPLADESAAVAIIQPMSVARLRAFHVPVAYLNDYTTFITAPPRRQTATRNFFARFMSPLTKEIWLCVAAAVVDLLISIEITIHLHEWTALCPQSHKQDHMRREGETVDKLEVPSSISLIPNNFKYHATLMELLKPTVNQGGHGQARRLITRNNPQSKFLLALWLLVIIVLGSGYQSAMKSRIVAPEYSTPPKTFRELANSHFGRYAILWTEQIQEPLSEFGLEYSKKLVESVTEFGYLDPDCYVIIHTGDNACIGPAEAFKTLGLMYSVDVNGKPLSSVSPERLFHRSITFAIARNHVGLLEKFNVVIRHATSSGLPNHWMGNAKI